MVTITPVTDTKTIDILVPHVLKFKKSNIKNKERERFVTNMQIMM